MQREKAPSADEASRQSFSMDYSHCQKLAIKGALDAAEAEAARREGF
ncbi:hypothetical protein [Gellertiella hungarica]|uniref:Uncharacterized protein n=1 Tax=Gellertiella hungarica TaxID=1572859 RepID=A0A7W6J312_9HYPH|nr:hypothetical protein [Gellertiella hungarica]MBB4063836.1 hypothetical protein [Gellertiella hungarica]